MIVYLIVSSKKHCSNCGAGEDEVVPITSAKAKRLINKRSNSNSHPESQKLGTLSREKEVRTKSEGSDTKKIEKYYDLLKKEPLLRRSTREKRRI